MEKVRKKKIWDIVSTIIVLFFVLLAIVLVAMRVSGITPYKVLSDNMQPDYPKGSTIFVKKAVPENVKAGDLITFVINKKGDLATQKVTEIDTYDKEFTTEGLGGDAPDIEKVPFNNVAGIPVYCIPYLGYISNWITTPPGSIIFICALALFIAAFVVVHFVSRKRNEDETQESKNDTQADEVLTIENETDNAQDTDVKPKSESAEEKTQ